MRKSTIRSHQRMLDMICTLDLHENLIVKVPEGQKLHNFRAKMYYLLTQIRKAGPSYAAGKYHHIGNNFTLESSVKNNTITFIREFRHIDLEYSTELTQPSHETIENALHRTYKEWTKGNPDTLINSGLVGYSDEQITRAWDNVMQRWDIFVIPHKQETINDIRHFSFMDLTQ